MAKHLDLLDVLFDKSIAVSNLFVEDDIQIIGIGFGALAIFFILRGINVYGNLEPWTTQKDGIFTMLSFFNITKYPPSLDFLLITLGPSFLLLYAVENIKNRFTPIVLVFGRVPFFYYLLHVLFIHLGAMLGLILTGGDWRLMILNNENFDEMTNLNAYGYSLWLVYLVWIGIVLITYPFCKWYMRYKLNNKDKWWLSYL